VSQILLGRWAMLALIAIGGVGGDLSAEVNAASDLWRQGVTLLKANDPKGAEAAFLEWAKLTPEAARSPEFHYNLGVATWETKQIGPSVFQLLQSTQGYFSPFRIQSTLKTVAAIQREIGIRDSPLEDWLFRWAIVVPENLIWISVALGFWGIVAAMLVKWLHGARGRRAAIQIGLLPAFLFFAGLACLTARWVAPDWSVLVDEQNGVKLYKAPHAVQENFLVDLPSGTVVQTGRQERGYLEVRSPVAGWVVAITALDPRVLR